MKLVAKKKLPNHYLRYDLSIKGTHNFVSNGIVVHNTSANISFNPLDAGQLVHFFSGGENHEKFTKLFDVAQLANAYRALGMPVDRTLRIHGEAYGGKQQGMSATYGPVLKFIAFDVKIGDSWLDVPNAHQVAQKLGLEFVDYVKVSTDLAVLDAERDRDSVQAIRNGMGAGKLREGVVLRPLIEVVKNNGERIFCKHKRDEFRETKSPRPIIDPNELEVISNAERAADEWVTAMRLEHVLDKIPDHSIEKMSDIIRAMQDDIRIEGEGEIVWSQLLQKMIGKKTVVLYKNRGLDKLKATV
jgi:hypothetical protein